MKKSVSVFKMSVPIVMALWGTASSQEWIRDLSVNLVGTSVTAKVDIKPGSCSSPLNVKSQGVLPVAVVGTEDLDAYTQREVPVKPSFIGRRRSRWVDSRLSLR